MALALVAAFQPAALALLDPRPMFETLPWLRTLLQTGRLDIGGRSFDVRYPAVL